MKHVRVLLGLIALIGAGPAPAFAVDLLPHRGAYRMSLVSATRTSGLVGARGLMIYQFGQSCGGWTVENRTYLQLTYESGASAETLWTFVSWESADGRRFRFRTRFEESGRVVEQIKGSASLAEDGGGVASLTEPTETEIALPVGTVFPTRHMIDLIEAAGAGEKILTHVVFDGASAENPYLVSTVVGPLPLAAQRALAASANLPDAPAWWARLAYYPLTDRGATPEFELGARFRADGVSGDIVQQFDDFTLRVQLDKFETLPEPEC